MNTAKGRKSQNANGKGLETANISSPRNNGPLISHVTSLVFANNLYVPALKIFRYTIHAPCSASMYIHTAFTTALD